MIAETKNRILFVCMGNICRSPMVEAVARVEFARAGIDAQVASAGTENYHVGDRADPRAISIGRAYGYPLDTHRARQVVAADFADFDHLLVMDAVNLRAVQRFRPGPGSTEPRLFLAHAGLGEDAVPDPYYGSEADFEHVVALARRGVDAMIRRMRTATMAGTA